ncbi:MAG: hypothetical protein LBC60_10040 [Spirochaetaceae bacterium]|jgi:hypothetical protein|nr:hypothetical protein [Spirochaetaceae bacterium]
MTDFDKAIDEAWHHDALAAMLPYESWERLAGESSLAFAAFCAFRDYGPERSIRKAVEAAEKDEDKRDKRYRVWRNWCTQFRWRERAADFDRYTEKLKQEEFRKTIEAQGEMHRKVTGKMLEVVKEKLERMNPDDLSQGTVTEWVQTAIRAEREAAGLSAGNGRNEPKQGELNFTPDFQGL